ncbi:MAG TPA: hypothetical protein VLC94_03655 [Candidatus Acidoferrum sp.]|nr:hypothetical protein [Candidatus Acidoferrum sp.]
MPSSRTSPPWEFLLSASRNSLQSYELSRLGLVSSLRKEIVALVDQWVEENSSAMLARWLMENREREVSAAQMSAQVSAQAPARAASADPSASDNFLPDLPPGRSPVNGQT